MNFKGIVQEKGFNVKTLAEVMGKTSPAMTQLLNGNPTASKLQEVADKIGCERWEFFADEMTLESIMRRFGPEIENEIERRVAERLGAAFPSDEKEETDETSQPSDEKKDGSTLVDVLGDKKDDTIEKLPTATVQQAIICPHCKRALIFNIASYEQK